MFGKVVDYPPAKLQMYLLHIFSLIWKKNQKPNKIPIPKQNKQINQPRPTPPLPLPKVPNKQTKKPKVGKDAGHTIFF